MYNSRQPLTKETRMYSSLRSNEFEFNNAIAEIVDNSIEANASEIYLFINTVFQEGKQKVDNIVIVDNGDGMSKEQVQRCLTLGESVREMKSSDDKKIGKFGVGLTLGGISIAKKIEIMSRKLKTFYNTYLSLDEIESGKMIYIPDVEECEPEKKYTDILHNSPGTIIKLSQCDRLNINPINGEHKDCKKLEAELDLFIGRVYRKFIEKGVKFYIGTERKLIVPYDPIYIINHDLISKDDYEKIKDSGSHVDKTIELLHQIKEFRIPDGNTYAIEMRLTLLPEKYRSYVGAGNSDNAKQMRITGNEGISILRCNREVLYGHVPYLIGKKGQYKSYEIDRFWGLEISFPPELDDYFHVKFIKRGAEPISELKEFIREAITPNIVYARSEIRRVFGKEKESSTNNLSETLSGLFPTNNDIEILSEEDFNKIINELTDSVFSDYEYKDIINTHIQENRESIQINLLKYRFSISFAELPEEELFALEQIDKYHILIINSKHKYVKDIIFQSIENELSGKADVKLFESQIAALISPLIAIDKMNKSIDKKHFSELYSEVLNDSVIK